MSGDRPRLYPSESSVKKNVCPLCNRDWTNHTITMIGPRLEWVCPLPK